MEGLSCRAWALRGGPTEAVGATVRVRRVSAQLSVVEGQHGRDVAVAGTHIFHDHSPGSDDRTPAGSACLALREQNGLDMAALPVV